jgi:tryptophan-rich sensory protein
MKLRDILGPLISALICLAVGGAGTLFTVPSIPTWYAGLIKPAFTPPGWLFGPAWTILYALMGIAAYIIWAKGFKKKEVKIALALFLVQLGLNAIWTPIFFGLHWLLIAFIEIIVLWLMLLWTIIKFYRLSVPAGWLLIPYLLWVSFASILNLSVWLLNK